MSSAMPLRRSPRIAAKMPQAPMSAAAVPETVCEPTEAMPAPVVTEAPASKFLPTVRKHPHVERVYLCDPKDASYMVSREEANTLAHWDFSQEDWDFIFCGESKVTLGMLCNTMTESGYQYGGLARAQAQQLKVEKDQYGCWNCNEFSSTLELSRIEANALCIWPEFSEEEWQWILCAEPTEKVEVRAICMALTPAHAKDAKRRAEAELALARLHPQYLPHYDDGRIISGGECVPLAQTPPSTPCYTAAEEEAIPPMPLLTPALIRQQAVDPPKRLSPEATAWIRSFRAKFTQIPSGKESIYAFIKRCESIGDLLQDLLSSPYFVEVMRDCSKGSAFAKACLQAANNLTGKGNETIEKTREELKYYRCPFSLKNQLNRHYKRIQALSAIMTATARPYINKHD